MKFPVSLLAVAITSSLALSGCSDDDNKDSKVSYKQPELETRVLDILDHEGYQFKDHNRDGKVNPFEDWRLSASERADDLVARMTNAEKAGAMMHGTFVTTQDATRLVFNGGGVNSTTLLKGRLINTLITRQAGPVEDIAIDNNRAQAIAEQTRLAIPVSISSDPRNHFNEAMGASVGAGEFSKWTETLGLAAIGDPVLTKKFADIIRQEYLAVGINQALHPTADIATEPRWGRNNSTFGEDANLSRSMTKAYVQGLQNSDTDLVKGGVWGVVKHFAGGGPQENGLDAHTFVGRKQVYPGNNLAYHRIPFKGAFEAGVAGVMPYYGMPIDQVVGEENVGFGYSKYLLTDVLRGEEKFEGVIVSDWLVANDCEGPCRTGIKTEEDAAKNPFAYLGMPWGVEDIDKVERAALLVDAGIDQFGGIDEPAELLANITSGRLTQQRINLSVKRILVNKFKQGLFESAFVDPEKAIEIVGKAEFQTAADDSQRRSVTLLKNEGNQLPLSVAGLGKVYASGLDATVASDYGLDLTDDMSAADTIIIRTETPATLAMAWFPFAVMMPPGELAFKSNNPASPDAFALRDYEIAPDADDAGAAQLCYPELAPLGQCVYTGGASYDLIKAAIATGKRVILDVFMIRPAALGNIEPQLDIILANYGTSDEAFLDVITGVAKPEGKLPFGLPFTTDLVEEFGLEDVPSFDEPEKEKITQFPFGHGLSYE
ncbi:glycoside hydrolase family 3 protein [Photobacterium lipolyticum]|nr:glycoside hydrolase family 3 N-terminal domain-containing protein [Photobacterium lipolyticum]